MMNVPSEEVVWVCSAQWKPNYVCVAQTWFAARAKAMAALLVGPDEILVMRAPE